MEWIYIHCKMIGSVFLELALEAAAIFVTAGLSFQ